MIYKLINNFNLSDIVLTDSIETFSDLRDIKVMSVIWETEKCELRPFWCKSDEWTLCEYETLEKAIRSINFEDLL